MPVIRDAAALTRISMRILAALGCAADEAQVTADHLVLSNLVGHDSHGIGMLPTYVTHTRQGLMKPNQPGRLARDDGAIFVFDGMAGFGQPAGKRMSEEAIARARRHGLALGGLINVHHIGRIGTYGEMCAEAGLVSVHMVNSVSHNAAVAPWRGAAARLSTNPVCIAVPATGAAPMLLLDMATSQSAVGKVRVAYNSGKPMPAGRLIDHQGRPTTDPKVLFEEPKGALTPAGEHKGWALGFMVEVLAGCLTGGNSFAPESPKTGAIQNNMLSILFDPARLADQSAVTRELEAYVRHMLATPPVDPAAPVLLPGDPERAYLIARRRDGVPVDDGTWAELADAAVTLGLGRDLDALVSP
jgi:uncharacterized oxidoreductase